MLETRFFRVALLASVCCLCAVGPLPAQSWEELLGALVPTPTPTAQPGAPVETPAVPVTPTPAVDPGPGP